MLPLSARIGSFFVLSLVFVALRFGRTLERGYPVLAALVPYFGIAVFVLGLLCLYLLFRARPAASVIAPAKWRKLSAQITLWLLASFLTCYVLVDFGIEVIHFVKYAALCVCLSFSQQRGAISRRALLACLATVAVGTAEETAQLWIPMRFFDPRDIALNISGALSGMVFSILAGRLVDEEIHK